MKTTIIAMALAVALFGARAASASCEISPERLGARYRISEVHANESEAGHRHGEQNYVYMQIWRRGDRQVAWVNEANGITDIWDLVVDGRHKLIRYFDEHERAIEYQPGEVETDRGSDAWSERYQVIADSLLDSLELVAASGEGCARVERYAGVVDGIRHEILWRPEINLAEAMTRSSDAEVVTWQLEELYVDEDAVALAFTSRERYHTTDFIDIGDNESDPFLQQMMALGFVRDAHNH